jgi:hypothetical protein
MALSNPSWGEERIANELLLKLVFAYQRVPYENICNYTRWDNHVEINDGLPLFAIMLQPFWPVISVLSSRQRLGCSTSWSLSNTRPDGLCIAM